MKWVLGCLIAVVIIGAGVVVSVLRRRRAMKLSAAAEPDAAAPEAPAAESSPESPATVLTAKRVLNTDSYNFEPFFHLRHHEQIDAIPQQLRNLVQEALQCVQDPGSGNLSRALQLGSDIKRRDDGFYFGYYIIALVLQELKRYPEAVQELRQGIDRSRQKHTLCAALGSLSYDIEDINEAVAWWINSVVYQADDGKVLLSTPFVFLAASSRACGLRQISELLLTLASRAHYAPQVLDQASEDRLVRQVVERGAETIHQALVVLYNEQLSKFAYD